MSFIDDEITPIEFLKNGLFLEDHFIGRNEDVPMARHDCVPNQLGTGILEETKEIKISKEMTSKILKVYISYKMKDNVNRVPRNNT